MKIGSTDIVNCKIGSTQVNEIRIGSTLVWQFSSVDPDAQAFITAAGITNPTQQTAINTLVVSLKADGLWTKMSAIYPFVGGTATTHKFNLKNPLDTNAAFRLTFFGGGTHSANGYQTNGTNAYAETYYNPSINLTSQNSNHISIYSRTNNQGGVDMGGGPVPLVDLELNYASTSYNWNMANYFSHNNTNSLGHFINTRTASNAFKLIKNGSTIIGSSTGAAGATKPNTTYHIGKRNLDLLWSNRQYAFASIGDGLTDTDSSNLYTAVQAFNTLLGRSVGPQTVSDADAQAFVTAANIQDQVQADAVNNLVIGLKADGLWTKMKAIYPFVGGDATSHKWNLKNPLDTNAAFRLVFNGGWTHSSTGALPNGTNGYADTFLIPNTSLTQDSAHISFYSRTNIASGVDVGSSNAGFPGGIYILNRYSGDTRNYINVHGSGSIIEFTGYARGDGFFCLRRNNSTQIINSRNAVNTTYSQTSTTKTTFAIALSTLNNGGSNTLYSARQCAFASIGDGLTDTDSSNLYTAVQSFQTALSRQV